MASKSKQKGSSWERDICKIMGEELGGNWMRVPNSGAFIGKSNQFRKANMDDNQIKLAKGDIIPPDDYKHINIEAKSYNEIAFHQIIDGCCKQLDNWIEQTEQVAEYNDFSMTIFKITRRGSWIAFTYDIFDRFEMNSYVIYNKKYVITDFISFIKNNKSLIQHIAVNGINIIEK